MRSAVLQHLGVGLDDSVESAQRHVAIVVVLAGSEGRVGGKQQDVRVAFRNRTARVAFGFERRVMRLPVIGGCVELMRVFGIAFAKPALRDQPLHHRRIRRRRVRSIAGVRILQDGQLLVGVGQPLLGVAERPEAPAGDSQDHSKHRGDHNRFDAHGNFLKYGTVNCSRRATVHKPVAMNAYGVKRGCCEL